VGIKKPAYRRFFIAVNQLKADAHRTESEACRHAVDNKKTGWQAGFFITAFVY